MRESQLLSLVVKVMPELSQQALDTFVAINLHWHGAGWGDCLDMLLDSDSHLDITDPAYEAFGKVGPLIAVTLFYAYKQEPSNEQIQYYVHKINEASDAV